MLYITSDWYLYFCVTFGALQGHLSNMMFHSCKISTDKHVARSACNSNFHLIVMYFIIM